MIYRYGIKVRGVSHEKSNSPCQDAKAIKPMIRCGDCVTIAAVADGLGSCAFSHIGSTNVVNVATRYCEQHITREDEPEKILKTIEMSFSEAHSEVEKIAESQGQELNLYHTTLSLAVLISDTLYYGHAGDSGIIALTTEGRFEKVTEQQRDTKNRVFPLLFNEDKWIFGQFGKKVCSVLLATDGILELLIPCWLRNEFLGIDESITVRSDIASRLMDNRELCIDEKGEISVRRRIRNYIAKIHPGLVGYDDVTIAVLVNTSVKPVSPPETFYPDWREIERKLQEAFERELYPHRFATPANVTPSADSDKSIENENFLPVGTTNDALVDSGLPIKHAKKLEQTKRHIKSTKPKQSKNLPPKRLRNKL